MIKQHDLLNRALATAKMGVWTYQKNSSVVELSINAQNIFGIDKYELSGIEELLERFASDNDSERFQNCMASILEHNDIKSDIYQIRCSQNISKWIRCIGQPDIDSESSKAIFGTVQDITEHIETERKLTETQRKYELMAKNSSDGIIIIDKETTTFVSPGFLRLMRYNSFEEYINSTKGSLRPVIHPDDKARIKKEFHDKMKNMASDGTYQFRAQTGDGTYIWREDHVSYQYDENGNLERTYAVCRDITGRKKSERKLRELIEEKNWLVSTIVHDIRNPISAAVSLNSVLIHEIKNPEHRELISAANDKLENALCLAAELLELSSMENEDYQIEKAPVNLFELFDHIRKSFEISAAKHNLRFDVICKNDLPELRLNREKIIRVLDNLISNAIKFTPDGGTVTLEAETASGKLIIEIRDTGIGISKDKFPTLFDKFTDAKREGLRGEETTGLGLSITKQIVELHNGTISVQSEPGQGTTFRIELPIQ